MIWPRNRDGSYLVRIWYHLLCEREMMDKASMLDTTNKKHFRKRIWRMRVPNKIKKFLWRAWSEALPTRANLFKQKVVDVQTCQLCGSEHETMLHALWSCQNNLTVWESKVWVGKEGLPTVDSFLGPGCSGWEAAIATGTFYYGHLDYLGSEE